MKHSVVAAAAAGLASASLTVSQTGAAATQDDIPACSGPGKACSDIVNIQTDCDKFKKDKNAHGTCMCNDSARFFKKWEECRQCLADNNRMSQDELNGWRACNSKAQADICNGNPSDLYPNVFATLSPGQGGTCNGGQSQPGASAGNGAPGASGASGAGASQTAAVTTGASTVSTSTASGTDSTGSVATGVAPSTGSVATGVAPSTGSVATGVAPSTGSSRQGSSASASASGSSNPASTTASTGSRNSTSSSSRSGSSNTVVSAAASPKAAFASVLAVAAAGVGFLAL